MTARPSHTELLLPADLAAIGATRSVLSELLSSRGWDDDRLEDAVLAASEAIGNAIEHGSIGDDRVSVTIHLSDEVLDLRVADTGRRGRATPPRLDTAPPPDGADRGRGLMIMRSLAAELELSRSELGGTEARMVFPSDRAPDEETP
mgnify:FL=1